MQSIRQPRELPDLLARQELRLIHEDAGDGISAVHVLYQREQVISFLERDSVGCQPYARRNLAPTGAIVEENPLHSAAQLSIPPNSVVRHDRYWPLPKPALVISFQPHMHFRGTRMTLEAIHPDGRREVLTDATHYEQNWQITYKYKVPHLFPAGTILHTTSWHDNTSANKHNPDPTAWIGWGSRTMDEMGHGWTDIAFLTDDQYREELAARRTGARTSN